ncbi:MAG: hypothetical protein AUH28_01485 [Acidobacteria bacterium 13_1_40CM_56_16]|nr:MAG: hypothetical protein AUH28_01485 [Acidobacteria bacterium 13_1_40CM_56_16]
MQCTYDPLRQARVTNGIVLEQGIDQPVRSVSGRPNEGRKFIHPAPGWISTGAEEQFCDFKIVLLHSL